MKESITKRRKWNLIAGGSDPINDVVSAELCQGMEDAMRHAYAKMKWLGRRKPGVRLHIIDPVMPPKPVSDTPRTDAISNASGTSWMNGNLCRQIERELNASNVSNFKLEEWNERLAYRIQQLNAVQDEEIASLKMDRDFEHERGNWYRDELKANEQRIKQLEEAKP